MTTRIYSLDSSEAYDLIYRDHLAMLSEVEQETMHRALENSSRLWIGVDGDKVLALWGLIPPTLLSDTAYLWLFTTEHLTGHTFVLIRHSQRAVQEMLKEFPTIVGHAKVGARRSMQWLRWLGAVFEEPINNVAIPFTIKAKQQWPQDSAQSA